MGDIDGLQVLERVRQRFPRAKVVIVTAVEQDMVDKEILKQGAKAVIRKPFSYEEFENGFKMLA